MEACPFETHQPKGTISKDTALFFILSTNGPLLGITTCDKASNFLNCKTKFKAFLGPIPRMPFGL